MYAELLLWGLLVDVEVLNSVEDDVLRFSIRDTKIVQIILRDVLDIVRSVVTIQYKYWGKVLEVNSGQQVGNTSGPELDMTQWLCCF